MQITTDIRLKQITVEGNTLKAIMVNEYSGLEETRIVDQIVVEAGTQAFDELYFDLVDNSLNMGQPDQSALLNSSAQPSTREVDSQNGKYALFRIGDCVSARGIHAATLDATRLCLQL